jgi:hypothetical protein
MKEMQEYFFKIERMCSNDRREELRKQLCVVIINVLLLELFVKVGTLFCIKYHLLIVLHFEDTPFSQI